MKMDTFRVGSFQTAVKSVKLVGEEREAARYIVTGISIMSEKVDCRSFELPAVVHLQVLR